MIEAFNRFATGRSSSGQGLSFCACGMAWVVMPNHVHAIVRPLNGWTLSRVLQGIKGTIAMEANRVLGMTGKRFWQPESFDRVIRDEKEMAAVRRYIRRNPVKAGLCATEQDWRWGSAWTGWSK